MVGGAEWTELDVGEADLGVGALTLNAGRDTRAGWASATSNTGLACGGIGGVIRVEPEHVDGVVVPQAHDENHTLVHGLAHGSEATLAAEAISVAEGGLLSGAETWGDGVASGDAWNVGGGLLDDLAVLDVEAADLAKVTGGSAVGGVELGDDGELALGVDVATGAVEGLIAETESIVVAAVAVTDAIVAVAVARTTLSGRGASRLASARATWVRGHCGGNRVGFPDVHFWAA